MRNLNELHISRIRRVGKVEIPNDEHRGMFDFSLGLLYEFHALVGRETLPDGSMIDHVTFYPVGKYGNRFPDWQEICCVRDMFFLPGERCEMEVPTETEMRKNQTHAISFYCQVIETGKE